MADDMSLYKIDLMAIQETDTDTIKKTDGKNKYSILISVW